MPRSGRGGKREGIPGTPYANRSDLREPISTVPDQTYGEAAQQQAAQRALPMAPAPTGTVPPAASTPPGTATANNQALQATDPTTGLPIHDAAPGMAPGELHWLGPTQRPDEPVTSGLPTGPGPGPESLVGVGQAGFGHQSTADLLSSLAQMPGAGKDVADLAAYAQAARA